MLFVSIQRCLMNGINALFCRVGLRSIVLESADSLRATGFALALWTNAWRALDALGIGDSLRQSSLSITG